MILLIIKGHTFDYEMQNICRLFLPHEKITVTDREDVQDGADNHTLICHTAVSEHKDGISLYARLKRGEWCKESEEDAGDDTDDKERERRLAVMLYKLFAHMTGRTLPWGAVTGVRPVKLLRRMAEIHGENGGRDWLIDSLLVSREKADLCLETLKAENKIIALSRPESFSLYVSVPFCPSRCAYCSFVSHTVERAAKLIPEYVDRLCAEINTTGGIARELGLRLETVYVGGGTPTVLSAEQLSRILSAVHDGFDLSALREFTVEAGRPDTLCTDKLKALKWAGVTRISINPQTLSDKVLAAIGRRHSAGRFYEAFNLARRCGFDNINTDLIAGLPGDELEGFKYSADSLLELSPESVTLHTLALKRASNLMKNGVADIGLQALNMIDYGAQRLKAKGYRPYYLYRQSRTVAPAENTGWSKPGYEGLYNVFIMDETHTVLACGAGGVTKLRQPGGDCIERVFNYKFPYEYISGFDDIIKRKERVITFYGTSFFQKKS